MITFALKYDAKTKMDRFASAPAPVMRLGNWKSSAEYVSHLRMLEYSARREFDCFSTAAGDERRRKDDISELAKMRTMTPAQWLSMEAAKSYRQQWVRYHAAKLNPALRYTFPVCLQLQSVQVVARH